MASIKILGLTSTVFVLASASILAFAGQRSNSPFANKKPKAWEKQNNTNQFGYKAPKQVPMGRNGEYQVPNNNAQNQPIQNTNFGFQSYKNYSGPQVDAPRVSAPQVKHQNVQSPQVLRPNIVAPNIDAPNVQRPQIGSPQTPAWAQHTYDQARQAYGAQNYQYNQSQYGQKPPQVQYQQNYQNQYPQQQYSQNQYANTHALRGSSKPSWLARLGFGNVKTEISGHAKAGVAAMGRSSEDVKAESVVDLDLRAEASAITEGGLEYGAGLRVRAQRDRYRRGFGGRVGDCPAADPACSSVLVNGNNRAIKGHTSQFYTDGSDDARETELALEGAYLFLRSSYGDFIIGRDDGAASLFSLGAPSLLAVGASNSPVDYTGLDSVKTWNDASGFSEKISYTSPRLLGDQIGFGVQFGLSFSPNARACGVDYCVRKNSNIASDPFTPEIKNIFEAGLSLDKKFGGLSAEITGTYAMGKEDSGLAGFADLKSYGIGMELKYNDFVFGTSYLNSNNGVIDGDYNAYDIGLTWKPNQWGLTASYGYADDNIAKLTSNQAVLGLSYDWGKIRLGTGVQLIRRNVPIITSTGRNARKQDAAALFFEIGTEF